MKATIDMMNKAKKEGYSVSVIINGEYYDWEVED
jgi:hypothetical protein